MCYNYLQSTIIDNIKNNIKIQAIKIIEDKNTWNQIIILKYKIRKSNIFLKNYFNKFILFKNI